MVGIPYLHNSPKVATHVSRGLFHLSAHVLCTLDNQNCESYQYLETYQTAKSIEDLQK